MIPRGVTLRLGIGQLVCWGVTYYLIGVLGEPIAADLGWSKTKTQGGFALALLVMGLVSPLAGRLIERHGGRPVMVAGSLLSAVGCAALAFAQETIGYYAAWICLGVAMRFTLYDAAFAALARIGGCDARGAMAEITLLGGLASTAFWPIGQALSDAFGWRTTALIYAVCALATAALHAGIPAGRFDATAAGQPPSLAARAAAGPDRALAGALYALVTTLTSFLAAGMSAAMIGILLSLGLSPAAAVALAALRGVGQSLARLCDVLFGRRLDPVDLNLLAALGLPAAFAVGVWSAQSLAAAVAFCFVYGASNGIATITRGTLPLTLFEPGAYARFVGGLVAPSFLASAAAPLAYAVVVERFGGATALALSAAAGAVTLAASLVLKARFGVAR